MKPLSLGLPCGDSQYAYAYAPFLQYLLGSRDEVLATLSEMLVADCEFTEKQRREIIEEIKRLHEGSGG
jgi:hypothetical protein